MKNWNLLGSISLFAVSLAFISPHSAYAGSGGAVGGNDSGSNLDSSTITGGTFDPSNSGFVETNTLNLAVQSLLDNAKTTLQCIPTSDGEEDCQPELGSSVLANQLKSLLSIEENTEQADLVDQFSLTLDNLFKAETINAQQFNDVIIPYNQLINSLNQEQLITFSETPETQAITTSLQELRERFLTQEDN